MALNASIISLVVVLFAIYNVQSAAVQNLDHAQYISPRANVTFGVLGPDEEYLSSSDAIRSPEDGVLHVAAVRYTGPSDIVITYIQAFERGPNQNAHVAIVAGGISYSSATVTITSVRGKGFDYNVAFYGRRR